LSSRAIDTSEADGISGFETERCNYRIDAISGKKDENKFFESWICEKAS
jgi:hypothetical protein